MSVHTTRNGGEQSSSRPMTALGVILAIAGWLTVVAFVWILPVPVAAFVGVIVTLYGVAMFVRHADPCRAKR